MKLENKQVESSTIKQNHTDDHPALSQEDSKTKDLGDTYINNDHSYSIPRTLSTITVLLGAGSIVSVYVMGVGVKNLVSHVADTVLRRPAEDRSPKPGILTNALYFLPLYNIVAYQKYG
ncbi:MAG: hypothetical protein CMO81_07865 [Waddliaceae bacterium]|nr:hypothetical protein [Waddliaceae bacterium]